MPLSVLLVRSVRAAKNGRFRTRADIAGFKSAIARTRMTLHFALSISRMSPWCTVATCPLSQAIVTPSQLVSVTMPPSAASPRQQTRAPFWSFLDSVAVKQLAPLIYVSDYDVSCRKMYACDRK